MSTGWRRCTFALVWRGRAVKVWLVKNHRELLFHRAWPHYRLSQTSWWTAAGLMVTQILRIRSRDPQVGLSFRFVLVTVTDIPLSSLQ